MIAMSVAKSLSSGMGEGVGAKKANSNPGQNIIFLSVQGARIHF